ncbi:coiled-coil domain-containing protein 33 isoform X2 [Clupea harengus]|uniref:Coiled-coil domain-containing protein 33 isoform X2 n=1 Tax=Clupea harengus TaxID=7950 RepID=A0A6P8F9S3_CLUHA|nr:coiled-coil domain-containing protein 33 isoform X2 [Clupea harengus]
MKRYYRPHTSTLQTESFGLPSYNALAQILPDYQHVFRTGRPEKQDQGKTDGAQNKKKDPAQINHTYETHSPHKRPPLPDFQDDPHTAEVTEHQDKELENYRTAMCKMAEDIIALRTQLGALEAENSHLRSDLSQHQEVGRTLLQDTDVDVMTKAEIADRIASLKVKLASETNKAASQRDKLQQLQNELIRNDSEKELERLRRAHQQQQAVLQRYQSHGAKMAGLESTVRQQEKVIEKMEKVLDTKLRERNKENTERKKLNDKDEAESRRKEIECVLAAENARLREELEKMRHQPPPVIIQQKAQTLQLFADREKLSLLSQLERAEARIRSLENQLKANCREWGREKQALTTKLAEHEQGFTRTSTMILHDLPTSSVTESVLGRIRHRQLDPLK